MAANDNVRIVAWRGLKTQEWFEPEVNITLFEILTGQLCKKNLKRQQELEAKVGIQKWCVIIVSSG